MKQFLILVAIVAAVSAQTEDQKAKVDRHVQHCSEETGVSIEDGKKFVFAVIKDDDKKNQCFIKCFYIHSGFIDADGKPDTEVSYEKLSASLKEQSDKDKLREVIAKCTSAEYQDKDPCISAFQMHNCYWSQ